MIFEFIRDLIIFYAQIIHWLIKPFCKLFEWVASEIAASFLGIKRVKDCNWELRMLRDETIDKSRLINEQNDKIKELEFKSQPFERAVVPYKEKIDFLIKEVLKREEAIEEFLAYSESTDSEILELEETIRNNKEDHAEEKRNLEKYLEEVRGENNELKYDYESCRERADKLNIELEDQRDLVRKLEESAEDIRAGLEKQAELRVKKERRKLNRELKKEQRENVKLRKENRLLLEMDFEAKVVYKFLLKKAKWCKVEEISKGTDIEGHTVRRRLTELKRKDKVIEKTDKKFNRKLYKAGK